MPACTGKAGMLTLDILDGIRKAAEEFQRQLHIRSIIGDDDFYIIFQVHTLLGADAFQHRSHYFLSLIVLRNKNLKFHSGPSLRMDIL